MKTNRNSKDPSLSSFTRKGPNFGIAALALAAMSAGAPSLSWAEAGNGSGTNGPIVEGMAISEGMDAPLSYTKVLRRLETCSLQFMKQINTQVYRKDPSEMAMSVAGYTCRFEATGGSSCGTREFTEPSPAYEADQDQKIRHVIRPELRSQQKLNTAADFGPFNNGWSFSNSGGGELQGVGSIPFSLQFVSKKRGSQEYQSLEVLPGYQYDQVTRNITYDDFGNATGSTIEIFGLKLVSVLESPSQAASERIESIGLRNTRSGKVLPFDATPLFVQMEQCLQTFK